MKFQSPRQVRLHHEDGYSIEMSTQRLNDASHNLPRSGPEVSCPVERAANRSPGSCRTTSVLTDRSAAFVCTTKLQLQYAVLRLLHRRKRTTQVQKVIMNIIQECQVGRCHKVVSNWFTRRCGCIHQECTLHCRSQKSSMIGMAKMACISDVIDLFASKSHIKIASLGHLALIKHQVGSGHSHLTDRTSHKCDMRCSREIWPMRSMLSASFNLLHPRFK